MPTDQLTPAEERLWFAEQRNRATPVYHLSVHYRFTGRLDVERLRTALDELAARHPALRRGFTAPGRSFTLPSASPAPVSPRSASPAPVSPPSANAAPVSPPSASPLPPSPPPPSAAPVSAPGATTTRVSVPLECRDARDLPEAQVQRLLDTAARTPFDLAAPPLLRALLVTGASGDQLLLTVHHLVCDGTSMARLEAELEELYTGVGPAPEPVVAVRQQRRDEGKALAYWRAALTGAPAGLSLPHDRARPRVLGVAGATHALPLPPELPAAMEALAARERLSPFMVWVLAYVAGLTAVTGDRDLVIAVPVSARRPEQQAEIGMFADIVPLRFVLPPGLTGRGLAALVRSTVAGALAYGHVPFQTLVERLWPKDDRLRAPLAQAALTYVDATGCALRAGTPSVHRELLPTGTAKFEVLWAVTRHPGRTVAELEYSTELFTERAAAALHQRMLAAATAVLTRPDAELPGGPAEPPNETPVHEHVRRHVATRPDAVAVRHHEVRLTYRQLDDRAAVIAAGLRAAGLRRGGVVALPMVRSADAVAACLGVLYAGCAYLPIDVNQPHERIRGIVRGTAHAAVVADDTMAGALAGLVPVLPLATLTGRDERFRSVRITGGDVAYVMSTSGSTGRPKAVVVPHRAITRLVIGADYVTVDPSDRVAHLSNPAFDAATFEIWGALANGATLVVEDRDVALSPPRLSAFLEQQRITVMWLTATLLHQVVDFAPDALRHLRVLLFGGEQADERRLAKLLAGHPPAQLINGYGPTENTTFSTCHEVSAADIAAGVVPIGRAIRGTTAHALDAAGDPVPEGETGELYVGGAGLALGYLGAPELTAAAFVPDPFDPRGGRRLYRTGDLVRVRPGGGYEFVGRADDQVKVRGFRVELGEIELALRRQPGVTAAVVFARPSPHGTEIVAGVAADPAGRAELDRRLRAELPDYLVPTLVVLDRIPVNANGKADRTALLAASRPAPEPIEEPETGAVAAIWCEVLDREHARPGDNFLTHGGHSLLALRLLSRLDEELGVQLDLADFLADPTLRGLTALVAQAEPTAIERSQP
ncbi:non-ribosomal peptide synthetase [Actinoplanes sp. N902-109]|uniref:non-ribosomal peptide synthetase n=1 Tax=Actinoplanes sp. (strain N902-109) TaxID=649831 RepID=UPI0003295CC2|nr:non-ribosomal peptide synthetase [Actinoplanes sp. N902-109]AGL19083.1 Non-ribosomal peptide synthase [Actinoplanes sp. N902-109]